ncbi:MAG: hypothetical protein HFH73_07760 [Lachnospiraceae bacterium]|jgi:hypothetical protein|nr:hypothetical protein [Lachnospiraceae bacterium]
MVDICELKYKVVVVDGKGGRNNITDYIENLGWEENDKEISVHSSFTARNDNTSKGYLSSLIKPNCLMIIYADGDGSGFREVARGSVATWEHTRQNSAHALRCTAYDSLYNLQKSQDNFFFPSGTGTKARIEKVLNKWGISLGKYDGPNKKHGKKKYQNKYLSDIILDILDDSAKKGSSKCIIRQEKGKTQIIKRGSNKDIYLFKGSNTKITNHLISIADMVTRVKIIGKEKKGGKNKVIAVLNGSTKYGVRQRIYTRGADESLADAKSAAKAILDDDGDAKDEVTVQAPDVPYVRKGDLVYIKIGSIKGYYYVLGVRHDADTCSMSMDLEKKKR